MLKGVGISLTLGQRLQTLLKQHKVTLLDGEAIYSAVKAQALDFKSQPCHQPAGKFQVSVFMYNFHRMSKENYSSTYLIELS